MEIVTESVIERKVPVCYGLGMYPKTVKEAVNILVSEMSGRYKLILRNTKREDLIFSHLSWGQEIRNRFGLWAGNEALMKDAGVDHPDSASTRIMEAVWDELQKG
jgi:hypothetical protein